MATSVQCTNKNCHLIWSINSFSVTPKNLMVGNKSVATIKNIKRCPTCGSSIKRILSEAKPKSKPKKNITKRRSSKSPKKNKRVLNPPVSMFTFLFVKIKKRNLKMIFRSNYDQPWKQLYYRKCSSAVASRFFIFFSIIFDFKNIGKFICGDRK